MKKIHLFSLFLIFVFLFCSCDNNVEQLKEGITPVITAEKEAVDSFSKIGEVKTVISIDPALLFPSSRSAVVSFGSLPEDQDGVTSIFHLVTFGSLEKNFEKYAKECPKTYLELPNTFSWETDYSGRVLIRSCYFESSTKPAYREAYFIDGYEEDLGVFIVREIKLSPDYSYSIDAEIEINTGIPKKYDWKSQTLKNSRQYVIDNETDFGLLSPSITKSWKYVEADGNPVKGTHSDARYIVEIDRTSASEFMKQKLFTSSSDRLRIGNFICIDADKDNKAYLELSK